MERRTALITGATRGLGLAIADQLSPDYDLLLGGRDPAVTEGIASGFPSARGFACDLSDLESLPSAVAGIEKLDVLVHSAGVAPHERVEELTPQEWSRVLTLNLMAAAELTRLLLPRLRASHGHVVFINAGLGLHTGTGWATYSASKFGLRAFADALREEERGHVKVTSIHPGRIDTDMQRAIYEAMDRPYNASDHLAPATVARAVHYVLDAGPEAMVEMLQIRPEAVG
ncbi:SDR family oxidoreductase [Propionicicella superfundia]|uniref:SDR family oxidoreductase n=1 Tax=Propionicicella superfundia TaxID=348582 RepID=UPI0003F90C34|nr:SDR family oxidoreductase [Propionicicella superfundia]